MRVQRRVHRRRGGSELEESTGRITALRLLVREAAAKPGGWSKALDVTLLNVHVVLLQIQVEHCTVASLIFSGKVSIISSLGKERAITILGTQYCGHWLLDHVESVHVALMNLVADVVFVDMSLQSPDERQAALLLQHMLVVAPAESHGTSSLLWPLGK